MLSDIYSTPSGSRPSSSKGLKPFVPKGWVHVVISNWLCTFHYIQLIRKISLLTVICSIKLISWMFKNGSSSEDGSLNFQRCIILKLSSFLTIFTKLYCAHKYSICEEHLKIFLIKFTVCQTAVHKKCHEKCLAKCPGSGLESASTIVSIVIFKIILVYLFMFTNLWIWVDFRLSLNNTSSGYNHLVNKWTSDNNESVIKYNNKLK